MLINYRCFTAKPTEADPEMVSCRWGVAEIRNSNAQVTQNLDRFRLPRA
jgi:hypothetical protein